MLGVRWGASRRVPVGVRMRHAVAAVWPGSLPPPPPLLPLPLQPPLLPLPLQPPLLPLPLQLAASAAAAAAAGNSPCEVL